MGSRDMRKYLLAACAIACLVGISSTAPAGSFNPQGQFVGAINPAVTALIAQFPNGGPGLRAAIARLLEANPSLADDVVAAAHRAKPPQKQAIGEGIADATLYLAKCGSDFCKGYEARIRWAANFADEETRIGVVIGDVPTLAQGIPGFNNAGALSNGCVTNNVISNSGPSAPVPPGC
jgi:hypothetical protein